MDIKTTKFVGRRGDQDDRRLEEVEDIKKIKIERSEYIKITKFVGSRGYQNDKK